MPRDACAYLRDMIEACDSIETILTGVDLAAYVASREKRSAVEREFIIIGEATATLRRAFPDIYEQLSHGQVAIGMRNVLTHDYVSVDHESVYDTGIQDAPRVKRECIEQMDRLRCDDGPVL
jgi:uncharacterized protein with HEPN domain